MTHCDTPVPVFVYLNTRFSAHSRLFPTIFAAAHTLYVTVPNWLFVRNILRLVKINPSPTKIWPLAPDIFTIFDQTHWTLKTPQLQNQFILDSGDKISSHLSSGKYCDCIIFRLCWLSYEHLLSHVSYCRAQTQLRAKSQDLEK